jgi:hypothetical protein
MQGWLPAHEIDKGDVFNPRQHLPGEKFVIHGFLGGLHVLFHVFVSEAVITLQITITIQNYVH